MISETLGRAPPINTFHDGHKQRRHADGEKDKFAPHRDCRQHRLGEAWQPSTWAYRDHKQKDAGWPQEPAGIAEPGHPFENPMNPFRQQARLSDQQRIDEQHAGDNNENKCRQGSDCDPAIYRP